MNQAVSHHAQDELTFEISNLIEKFGRRQAMIAILKSFSKGKGRPPDALPQLTNHLLRDVGLPEASEPTRHRDSGQF